MAETHSCEKIVFRKKNLNEDGHILADANAGQ